MRTRMLLAAGAAAAMAAGAAPAAAAPLTLDPAFGGGAGWVGTPFSDGAAPDYVKDATTTPDGRIVVVGQAGSSGATGIGISVYDANGALSPSFSGDGKKTISLAAPGNWQEGAAVTTYADGRIVVAGFIDAGATNEDLVVVVLKPNGDPDPGFGGGSGIVVRDLGGSLMEFAQDVAIDKDGDIVVVGGQRNPDMNTMIAVFKPDGSPQTGFNGTGYRILDEAPGTWDEASAVAVDGAGNYVVTGQDWTGIGPTEVDTLLLVLQPGGALFGGFSGDGRATADRSEVGRFDAGATVLATPSGYVVGGGLIPAGAVQQYDAFTMRVPLDGTGYTTRPIDLSGAGRDDSFADLALDGDRILATGGIQPAGGGISDRDHMAAVLNLDGTVQSGPLTFLMGDTDAFWSGTAVVPAPALSGGLAGTPLIVAGSLVQGTEGVQFGVARIGIPGTVPVDPPPPGAGGGGGGGQTAGAPQASTSVALAAEPERVARLFGRRALRPRADRARRPAGPAARSWPPALPLRRRWPSSTSSATSRPASRRCTSPASGRCRTCRRRTTGTGATSPSTSGSRSACTAAASSTSRAARATAAPCSAAPRRRSSASTPTRRRTSTRG